MAICSVLPSQVSLRSRTTRRERVLYGRSQIPCRSRLIGIPVKLRQAPAAYHSTEQGEMDGPPSLVSLRLVARNSEASLLGSYTNTFLHAQAVSTWQAMMEAGRPCFLLVIDGSLDDALEPLATFFSQVEEYLHQHPEQ